MNTNNIYREILLKREMNQKMLAVLLDPQKCFERSFAGTVAALKEAAPDMIFMGGSHINCSFDTIIHVLKEEVNIPILLFPGDMNQIAKEADAMLLLSLLSGRNPEYLIGQHVRSALMLAESGLQIIPTAYILIDGGKTSATEYISNTRPIPADQDHIALSTVLAGELLGMHMTYLEAGSGAIHSVPAKMIELISDHINGPLIVGGGIRDLNTLESILDAGADLVVIGNHFEQSPRDMKSFVDFVREYNLREKISVI